MVKKGLTMARPMNKNAFIRKLGNRVFQGDCLEVMAKFPTDSVDLILCDPPYLMNYRTNRRKDKNHRFCAPIANDDNPKFIAALIGQCHRVLKPNRTMYMFCNDTHVDFFKQKLEKWFKIRNLIVWIKNNHTAGDLRSAFGKRYEFIFLANKGRSLFRGKRLTDVWGLDSEERRMLNSDDRPKLHQNQKPIPLLKRCILKHSNPGDLVLDPVCGSGSALIAAVELERDYIGIEIETGYVEQAQQVLAEFNRKKNSLL